MTVGLPRVFGTAQTRPRLRPHRRSRSGGGALSADGVLARGQLAMWMAGLVQGGLSRRSGAGDQRHRCLTK